MQKKFEKLFLVLGIMAFEPVMGTCSIMKRIHVISSQRVTKQS